MDRTGALGGDGGAEEEEEEDEARDEVAQRPDGRSAHGGRELGQGEWEGGRTKLSRQIRERSCTYLCTKSSIAADGTAHTRDAVRIRNS